jgi:DNA-directed RNA polymerase subunit K/omega
MSIKTISMREMEKQSEDVFESVIVISNRARQINQNRYMDAAIRDAEESEMGVFDELPPEPKENYEEEVKSTTQAVEEFIAGKLKWRNSDELDI